MPDTIIKLDLHLDPDSAWALAQFLKRSRWEHFLGAPWMKKRRIRLSSQSAASKRRWPRRAKHLDEPGRRRRAADRCSKILRRLHG
jgi:hypothetical protein